MKKFIIAIVLLFAPLLASASIDRNLYYGLRSNEDVKELQEYLTDKGFYKGNVTGNFFSITLSAVKKYQRSIKLNGTGYVGILTRTAINNDLAVDLADSDQDATNETGFTPTIPTPTPTNTILCNGTNYTKCPSGTDFVCPSSGGAYCQQQQQAQIIQQLQQTVQQIQQNTQQIVQNTCTPNWQCISWSTCSNSTQTRTCTDSNSCGNDNGKPVLTQSCSMPTPAPSCTLSAVNQDSSNDYHVLISWVTQGVPDGTIGKLFAANRWVGGVPDFDYGHPNGGSPILKAPSGSYPGVGRSEDYKAVFGDVICTTKLVQQ